jgi:hypothetical protein
MRGPQISGESFGILKRFIFGESRNVEVRGDFANAFNRAGRGDPVGDVTSPLFGRITGAGTALATFNWRRVSTFSRSSRSAEGFSQRPDRCPQKNYIL